MTLLRLLHLSDIHFNVPECLNARTSRDASIRRLIVEKTEEFVEETKIGVNAILITGDIAFKANAEEFDVAKEWLFDMAPRVGADVDEIYVVPGNHDVNRQSGKGILCQAIRNAIMQHQGEQRHDLFMRHLQDAAAQRALMAPLEEYNEFAKHFGCQTWAERICWEFDVPFCEHYTLRINGLNSVVFSGDSDHRANLYMGEFQSNLTTEPGIVNLAMFHHPYDWLSDGNSIEGFLYNRAQLILVGHRHEQRSRPSDTCVLFAGGAINPCRKEGNWKPAFNIIDLDIEENDQQAELIIRAHLFEYQDDPEMFVAKKNLQKKDWFEYRLPIKKAKAKKHKSMQQPSPSNASQGSLDMEKDKTDKGVELIPTINMKSLGRQFWELSPKRRREIVNKFGLLDAQELELPEFQRIFIFLNKIQNRNLVEELISEINLVDK